MPDALDGLQHELLQTLALHPHHDTPSRMASLLGHQPPLVQGTLERLVHGGLAQRSGEHHQLTYRGFRVARDARLL